MCECYKCGFWDSDYEACICLSHDMWYACPIEAQKAENKKEMEEFLKWLVEKEGING